jgi:hypothetical protein
MPARDKSTPQGSLMQNPTKLRSFWIALGACAALLAGTPLFAQHVRVGYAGGGWHGGYGWRGGYYGGYHGGYYGGWRGGYYGWGWPGYYYGPWGWGGYGYGAPYYYSTYGWGGVPYYSADHDNYQADHGESASAGPAQQPVVYPKNGQNQEQQGKDTYECHRWAVGQTGFDPTQGAPGHRSEYFRAQAACLEGRGYAVN